MKLIITLLLFCPPITLLAQTSSKDKTFINTVIAKKEQAEKEALKESLGINSDIKSEKKRFRHLYKDSVGQYTVNLMRSAMENNKKGVFYGTRKDSITFIDSLNKRTIISIVESKKLDIMRRWLLEQITSDSIKLTDKERTYINSKIDQMQRHVWDKGLLKDADMITDDSLTKVLSVPAKTVVYDGWEELRKKGYDQTYNFSVPIYFRNDTYCMFYYGYECGFLCGYGEVAVYKKVNGKWEYWSVLVRWIS